MSHYIVEPRCNECYAVIGSDRIAVCVATSLERGNLICNALNERGTQPDGVAPDHPIRGEFVRIAVVAEAQPANNVSANPFAQFHAALVGELARTVVPKLPINPEPADFEEVADYLIRMAQMFDRCLKAIGDEVDRNSTIALDKKVFDGMFFAAVDGQATFECDRAANTLREEHAEIEGEARRGDRGSDFADELFKMARTMNRAMYGV